jgi:hypothetical protein
MTLLNPDATTLSDLAAAAKLFASTVLQKKVMARSLSICIPSAGPQSRFVTDGNYSSSSIVVYQREWYE